ncbi:MAG TPA: hypothetical protein VFZ01_18520 [Geminicoccaceae bacterium]
MASLNRRFQDYQPSKTALLWSCAGTAVAVMILGFTWGGWVTGGTANEMAEEAAEQAQAQLAAGICVDRFMAAADARSQLASLQEISSSWRQENFIEDGGWATIAGEEYDDAAELCAEALDGRELPAAVEAANPDVGNAVQ